MAQPLPEPKVHPVKPLQGCHTAVVTPFTADGRAVEVSTLKKQIAVQADAGVAGIVPCGTTGESPTLSEAEHRLVVETAVAEAKPRGLLVTAGAGSNSTSHAVHLHKMIQSLGVDAALHVSPYYNKPSQEGLYRHFMTIADSAPLPIMLYNIPGRCGVAILPETIERLSKHPNIVAVKEAT
ncbi:MAG: 4-hydroxy-tetrahydrodipicolinate synthase, partial [Phycisphaerae bacterium]|nr:4-hydroxy-tetrahydrodipicolinate synthase [Phycisphaerae bacterium]